MGILKEYRELNTGIFWYEPSTDKFIVISKECSLDGIVDTSDFNAKSGNTYNHEKSWEGIKSIYKQYRNLPYNYFPRGRVMIKHNVADVYYHPYFDKDEFKQRIYKEFGLNNVRKVRWHVDGSNHYKCYLDDEV